MNEGGNAAVRPLYTILYAKGFYYLHNLVETENFLSIRSAFVNGFLIPGYAKKNCSGQKICVEKKGEKMIHLRPYKPSDAWKLVEWWEHTEEEVFMEWSAGKFSYPLTIEQLDGYFEVWGLQNEDGWMMTALDRQGEPAGHLLMRLADYAANTIRFGFVVIKPGLRGKGIGREMLSQALAFAFDILGMERVTLGVFSENERARHCYESLGFVQKEYVPGYMEYKGKMYGVCEMEVQNKKPLS